MGKIEGRGKGHVKQETRIGKRKGGAKERRRKEGRHSYGLDESMTVAARGSRSHTRMPTNKYWTDISLDALRTQYRKRILLQIYKYTHVCEI